MIIKVTDLVKRYGKNTAVDHLSFEVRKGEVFGLLGPNGSGKTTTINCILSLLSYDQGTIQVFEKDMHPDAFDVKKDIGVVLQNVAVFNELTVEENIDYFCGLYIKDRQKRKALVKEAIAFVGLEKYEKYQPKKLSGGLLRRLNIACGIAHQPKLIILDEPTVAVDPQSRNKILDGILELNKKGATVIYTSHYMEEVEQICSRIMIMDHGKSIATGTKEALKAMIDVGEKITVEIYNLSETMRQSFETLDHVASVTYEDKLLKLNFLKNTNNLEHVLSHLKKSNIPFEKIYSENPTLNDVFLEITGRALRD